MISIDKIAKEAKVSSMTVSRVFDPRHADKVKAATRERILSICRKYDYSPKYSARSLASGRTFTVGLVMNDFAAGLASPTLSLVIGSIMKELEKHSYSLNMIYCAGRVIDEMNEKILDVVYSKRVDGFMFFSEMLTDKSIEKLKKTQIPAVALSMPSEKTLQEHVSYVYTDNCAATRDAIAHLKNLGVRKALYISVISLKNSCADRNELFLREAETAGLPVDGVTCDYTYRHLRAISDSFDWVLKNWSKIEKYDAWVLSNDLMAVGALKALELKGASKSKAIIGFDNIEENVNYVSAGPVITTIAPPHQDLGKEAAKLLIEQIQSNEHKQIRLALPSKLIIRDSSRNWKAVN